MSPLRKKVNDADETITLSSSSSETDTEKRIHKKRRIEKPRHDQGKNLATTCNKDSVVKGNSNNKVQSVMQERKDDKKNVPTKKKQKRKYRTRTVYNRFYQFACEDCRMRSQEVRNEIVVKPITCPPVVTMRYIKVIGKNGEEVEDFKNYMSKYVNDSIAKFADFELVMTCFRYYYCNKPIMTLYNAKEMVEFFECIMDDLRKELDELQVDIRKAFKEWCDKTGSNSQSDMNRANKRTNDGSLQSNVLQTSSANPKGINMIETDSKNCTKNETNIDGDTIKKELHQNCTNTYVQSYSDEQDSNQNTPIKREDLSICENDNLNSTWNTVDSENLNQLASFSPGITVSDDDDQTSTSICNSNEKIIIQDCSGTVNIHFKDTGKGSKSLQTTSNKLVIVSNNKDLIFKQRLNRTGRNKQIKIENEVESAVNNQLLQITFNEKEILITSL